MIQGETIHQKRDRFGRHGNRSKSTLASYHHTLERTHGALPSFFRRGRKSNQGMKNCDPRQSVPKHNRLGDICQKSVTQTMAGVYKIAQLDMQSRHYI